MVSVRKYVSTFVQKRSDAVFFRGTVFYNQWSQLSPLQISMLCVGITVLLAGVWIVSLQPGDASSNDAAGDDEDGVELFEEDPDNYDWELSQPIKRSKLDSVKRMLLEDAPRGFRIGLAASSPGEPDVMC